MATLSFESHERPEFDVIKTILLQAREEFQDYDKSGEFRSLQVKPLSIASTKLTFLVLYQPLIKILKVDKK